MWLTIHSDDHGRRRTAAPRIVTVHGEIDMATAERLRDQLTEILHRHTPHLIVDLSGITFCDSSGLLALRGAARRAELLGGRLVLAAPSGRIRTMLEITGLDGFLPAFPTIESARAAISGRTHGDLPAP